MKTMIIDGKLMKVEDLDLEEHLTTYYNGRKNLEVRLEQLISQWDAIKELVTPEFIADMSKKFRTQLVEYHEEFDI